MGSSNKKKATGLGEFLDGESLQALQSALSLSSDLISSDRGGKIIAGVSTGIALGKFGWSHYKKRVISRQYTIKISSEDNLFSAVHRWLLDVMPHTDQRSVVVTSNRKSSMYDDSPVKSETKGKRSDFLNVFYDGERKQKIDFAGERIEVHVSEEKNIKTGNQQAKSLQTVTLVCPSIKSRDAILDMLTESAKDAYERRPQFWVAQKWGNFRSASDIPVRPESTVVLRQGQKEKIISHLSNFLTQEEVYVRLGIPWHMGLLLYGPPGSGKTSIATTLAHTLGIDIHYISLSSVEDDNSLLELLGDVTSRSILLLEDIDVARASKERDDSRTGVTLSGLLNGLDGIATPHGIITIMTTNHYESLDPALVRPGRVDLSEEIGYVDSDQIERLCETFINYIPNDLPKITVDDMIVASEIVEVFKTNLDDLSKAGPELVETLKAKLRRNVEGPKNVSADNNQKNKKAKTSKSKKSKKAKK